jgi:hypothetical protein
LSGLAINGGSVGRADKELTDWLKKLGILTEVQKMIKQQ